MEKITIKFTEAFLRKGKGFFMPVCAFLTGRGAEDLRKDCYGLKP